MAAIHEIRQLVDRLRELQTLQAEQESRMYDFIFKAVSQIPDDKQGTKLVMGTDLRQHFVTNQGDYYEALNWLGSQWIDQRTISIIYNAPTEEEKDRDKDFLGRVVVKLMAPETERLTTVEIRKRQKASGNPPKVSYSLAVEKPVMYDVDFHPKEFEEFNREDVSRPVLLAGLCEIVYAYSKAAEA